MNEIPYPGILTCTATDLPGFWRRAAPRFLSRTLVTYLIAPPGSGDGCMVYVAFVIHARSRRIPGLTRRPVDQDGETVPVSRPG